MASLDLQIVPVFSAGGPKSLCVSQNYLCVLCDEYDGHWEPMAYPYIGQQRVPTPPHADNESRDKAETHALSIFRIAPRQHPE